MNTKKGSFSNVAAAAAAAAAAAVAAKASTTTTTSDIAADDVPVETTTATTVESSTVEAQNKAKAINIVDCCNDDTATVRVSRRYELIDCREYTTSSTDAYQQTNEVTSMLTSINTQHLLPSPFRQPVMSCVKMMFRGWRRAVFCCC